MKLSELIIPGAVVPELEATDRNGVIRELVESLRDHSVFDPDDEEKIVQAAVARERQGSTGFGKGVAVPHVKHKGIRRMAATIGRSSRGVDFAALDRAPVFTIVLLLSPSDDAEGHLGAMEKIFRHLQRDSFRRFLRQAESREAIVELISESDEMQSE